MPQRGGKPGFYVVVSCDFIASHQDVETVVCAPIYRETLGLRTEVGVGPADGLPADSAIRCDFLTLLFKRTLTGSVATLAGPKQAALRRGLAYALQLD
ncbi:MAG TPA: hypothetical protein VGI12_17030 [Vicinamibacterales bacterium]